MNHHPGETLNEFLQVLQSAKHMFRDEDKEGDLRRAADENLSSIGGTRSYAGSSVLTLSRFRTLGEMSWSLALTLGLDHTTRYEASDSEP